MIQRHYETKRASLLQRIELLEVYVEKLLHPPPSATPSRLEGSLHGNWSASDWESFDNLYHVYAPKLSLSNGTRNVSRLIHGCSILTHEDSFAILLRVEETERFRVSHGVQVGPLVAPAMKLIAHCSQCCALHSGARYGGRVTKGRAEASQIGVCTDSDKE